MNRNEQLALAQRVADEFLRRVKPKLSRKALRRLDSNDCRQQAAVIVLECQGDARMASERFLRKVVWINLIRWLKTELAISDFEGPFPSSEEEDDSGPEIADPRAFGEPSERAQMNAINRQYEALSENHRSALAGILEGKSLGYIGGLIGVSKQAVYKRQQTALNLLRTNLGVA